MGEHFFKSDFGNIAYDYYQPKKFNHKVIQIAHGMVEHKGRYIWLANELTKAGYKVYINDHRGHGNSIGGHITLGEMGQDGFEMATKDMLRLNEIIKKENPNCKIILLGHSMGSLLSRRFLQLYGDRIDALILSGTPSPNPLASIGSKLSFLFEKISFTKGLYKFFQKIIFSLSLGGFNKKFSHQGKSQSYWICSDDEVVKQYDLDDKCRFIFSLNSFGNLLKGLNQVFSPYQKIFKDLPILFLSGEEDACGEFGKGVQKAIKHIKAQGYNNVESKLYPICRHEVFNEPRKQEYLQDMLEWLKSQNLA